MILQRLKLLREMMRKENIDYYLITNQDPHHSEYTSEFFHYRTLFSGFTGSNGTLLVGLDEAYLWTDGRYFIQAEKELAGTNILLMRMGERNVPTIGEFLAERSIDITLGFDGMTTFGKYVRNLKDIFAKENQKRGNDYELTFSQKRNLPMEVVNRLEPERCPSFRAGRWFVLNKNLRGQETKDKIDLVRDYLQKQHADFYLSAALDKNMWLLNMRGCDIKRNPVGYSYLYIGLNRVILFCYENALGTKEKEYLKQQHIEYMKYEDFTEKLVTLSKGLTAVITSEDMNCFTEGIIEEHSKKVIDSDCGISLAKACKTKQEIKNMKKIYEIDSACVCKFLYWLYVSDVRNISEYEAALKMDEIRLSQKECFDLSFDTIAAYGPNAAMMHYEATAEQYCMLKPQGMFLIDSGGQYYGGTTDVTRTVALGKVSEKMKKDFTLALKGMISLSNAVFMKGTKGANLDILAREPLWRNYSDYKCGTGHGIGYMLGVHETPPGIRPLRGNNQSDAAILPGMVVSNEPGVYKENQYGIRIENILLCKELFSNEDGDFYGFETLTLVPIDLRLVDESLLNTEEKDWLFKYHQNVYKIIAPYLNEKEREWLKHETGKEL